MKLKKYACNVPPYHKHLILIHLFLCNVSVLHRCHHTLSSTTFLLICSFDISQTCFPFNHCFQWPYYIFFQNQLKLFIYLRTIFVAFSFTFIFKPIRDGFWYLLPTCPSRSCTNLSLHRQWVGVQCQRSENLGPGGTEQHNSWK